MFVLKITKAAKSDLAHVIEWYNRKQTNLGYAFLEEVNQNLKFIVSNLQLFQVKYAPYHEVPLKRFPYIITYIVKKQEIIVKSVMAGKQNPIKKYR